jgi:hypothetical protein
MWTTGAIGPPCPMVGSVCASAPVAELVRGSLVALGGDCDARSRPTRRHSASEASAEPSHPQFHRAPWSDSYLKILEELFGSPNSRDHFEALMPPALLSNSIRIPAGGRGGLSRSLGLQRTQGIPTAPQPQAWLPSQGRSGWRSQTQPQSLQRAHLIVMRTAPRRPG